MLLSIGKLNEGKMKIRNQILILGLLLTSFVLNAAIPAPNCKYIATETEALKTPQNKEAVSQITEKAINLNASYAIAEYIYSAVNLGIKRDMAIEILMKNPYVRDIEFPKEELTQAFLEYKSGNNHTVEAAIKKLMKHVTAFRNGTKSITETRDYDIEIETIGIKNQCRLGSCWAYAATAFIELLVKHYVNEIKVNPAKYGHLKHLKENQIQTAVEHYYALYIINAIRLAIDSGRVSENEKLFVQGGTFFNFMAYAKSFGAGVPQNQWAPIKAYKKAMFKDAFLDSLKKMALNYHKQIEEMKKSNLPRAEKEKAISELKQDAYIEIEIIVESYTDNLAKKIEVNGKELSSREFYKTFIAPLVNEMTIIKKSSYDFDTGHQRARVEIIDDNLVRKTNTFSYRTLYNTPKSFDDTIIRELIKGKPIYIATAIPSSSFKDKETGEVHQIINGSNGLTTMYRVKGEPKIRGGHALVIVGAELKANGRIATLKIQNSWGAEHGDAGFLHVNHSFLDAHTKYVITID